MPNFIQDVKFAVRTLLKSPGFTLVAVLTLALGIGANTAIFTVVNAVILRPLPYQQPEQLLEIGTVDPRDKGLDLPWASLAAFDEFGQSQSFSKIGAFSPNWEFTLTGQGQAESIRGYWITPSIFQLLGVQPAAGRAFVDSDDLAGAPPVAMLSYAFWQQRFGGRADVIGTTLRLSDTPYTVVGVMPADFRWLEDARGEPAVWAPLSGNPFAQRPRVRLWQVVGRLKPGVSIEQARAEMTTIDARLAEKYPDGSKNVSTVVLPLAEQFSGKVRDVLVVLLGTVALILLIACANVANLLLARATGRAREMVIRAALGAGRMRLIRQMLTESVLLSIVAGGAGLLLASWGVELLIRLSPTPLPRQHEIAISAPVLLFTLGLSVLTGIIFGLAPALQVSRAGFGDALKEGGRGGAGSARHRLRAAFTVAETALSLILLVSAGLLIKSFVRMTGVDPGFQTARVVTMGVSLPPSKYSDAARRIAFTEQLYAKIAALPGVVAVGDNVRTPLGAGSNPTSFLLVEGRPVPPDERPMVDFRRASRDYFRAMSIPLIEGRFFAVTDTADAPPVAIINEATARKVFPGESAVGKRVATDSGPAGTQWLTIVGVVGDIRHVGLNVAPRPEYYIHSLQAPPNSPQVMVRTSGDTAQLQTALRQLVREMDSDIPIQFATMADVRYKSMAQPRFQMLLMATFAGVALVLALIGIYGVMAYSVTQRIHEIGIRMALGAQQGDVLRLVIRQGMWIAATGIAVGTLGALAATRLLRSMLFDVAPTDPATFAAIAALLAAAALAACYIPARRAARVDPMVALRYE